MEKNSKNAKPNKIKTKKFFDKADKISRQLAVKAIANVCKKDNLTKKLQDMVVVDDSYIKECVTNLYRGVLSKLQGIANSESVRKLEKEIYNRTAPLADCIIKDIGAKNLSKKQKKVLGFLREYMEDTIIRTAYAVSVVESCVNSHVAAELKQYFKDKREELKKLRGSYEEVMEQDVGKDVLKSPITLKYKYIKNEMNRLFFDKLKKSLPKKTSIKTQ